MEFHAKDREIVAKCRVRIEGSATGTPTPHDGRYVVAWNSNVPFGTVALDSTDDPRKAKVFDISQARREWLAISTVQPIRYDGRPNRPLTALNVSFEEIGKK